MEIQHQMDQVCLDEKGMVVRRFHHTLPSARASSYKLAAV
jgi:hypothetical protein